VTRAECVHLMAFIASRLPAQKAEDATADSWYMDLKNVELMVAIEAVRSITARQNFLSLAELLAELKAIGNERRQQAELERGSVNHRTVTVAQQVEINARGRALCQAALVEVKAARLARGDDPAEVEREVAALGALLARLGSGGPTAPESPLPCPWPGCRCTHTPGVCVAGWLDDEQGTRPCAQCRPEVAEHMRSPEDAPYLRSGLPRLKRPSRMDVHA
jgi:hypothetical protein